MKVIVNSGNVGTPVAVELANLGHEVTLAVRQVEKNQMRDQLKIKQVPFDINDSKSMEQALKGHEAFFSLTPLVENLVECGTNAVLAAKRAGLKRIVRSSAQGASASAAIQLGKWHYEVEKAVEASGIPFSIIRPANFMQNYLTFGFPETIKYQSKIYAPMGSAKISIIDTGDISSVAARLLVEPGHEEKRYDLTGSESLSIEEVAGAFSQALGRKITYVDIPDSAAREGMTKAGLPPWLVDVLSELNAVGKAGYLAAVKPEVELVLKRKPKTFARFLHDHLRTFQT